jgi:energy-coupling factor transporter ATP-binding protein EcfA2
LLERLPGQNEVQLEAVQFQILPEVRALLRKQLDPAARQTVLHLVTQVLERRWNRRGNGPSFEALITDPSVELPPEAVGLVHVANLSADMLDELPDEHFREMAARLRTRQRSNPGINSDHVKDLTVSKKSNGQEQVFESGDCQFVAAVQRPASQAVAASVMDTQRYVSRSNYYKDLFIDLKVPWSHPVYLKFENLFVKTLSYALVDKEQVFFVVGRRGSGRSTIAQALPFLNPERIIHSLEINADHYNLEALFALFSTTTYKDDTERFFPRLQGFEMTWESAIFISSLQFLIKESDRELPDIMLISNFLDSLTNISIPQSEGISWSISDLFSYCFSRNLSFMQDCIDRARSEPEDAFWADIASLYNLENFLVFILGSEILKLCRIQLRAFQGTFLVSLDGFDDAFDSFRVESVCLADKKILQSRASFEIDWLRSLLAFTLRAYRKRDNPFYSLLQFYIAVPLDRFLEVARINRASYRAIGRWYSIQWSGIELSILLRKRLEFTLSDNLSSPKNVKPEERLSYILRSQSFKHLPEDVSFNCNGKFYEMPLFLYVLRHTFWRPREVLIYYARLLALADTRKRWKTHIDTQSLRSCIKSAAGDIIKSQFIGEFKTSFLNIEEVISSFRYQPNILDYSALKRIVQSVDFVFVTDSFVSEHFVEKLNYLYTIGFLGFNLDPDQQERLGSSHKDAFVFNEGPLLFADEYIDDEDLAVYRFVIHPIFCDFLKLDTSESDFTLLFDWDYLHQAESNLRLRSMIGLRGI